MRLTFELDPQGLPLRKSGRITGKGRKAEEIESVDVDRSIAAEFAVQVTPGGEQPIGELLFQMESVRALEMVLFFAGDGRYHPGRAKLAVVLVPLSSAQIVPFRAEVIREGKPG